MIRYKDIFIRSLNSNDLSWLVGLRNTPEVWRYSNSIGMISDLEELKWFESLTNSTNRKFYIVETILHIPIGIVRTGEIEQLHRSIQIGADLHPDFQGLGYGRKIYEAFVPYCFDQLNMNRIWLLVMEDNERAINLYKKMNFIEEGRQRKAIYRDGKYLDWIMMSILKDEWLEIKGRKND